MAVVVVGLLALGVGVIGAIGSGLADAGRTAEPGYERYRPPGTPSLPVIPTMTTEQPPPAQPTGEQAPPSGPTTTSPSALPRATPVLRLGDHPINRDIGVPAITCPLPRFSQDTAGQERFYRAALPCLDAAWAPVLRATNLPFGSPVLLVVDGHVGTPCGGFPTSAAWYCSANSTIYMYAGYFTQVEQLGDEPGRYLDVLAHEYGHHVQGRAGISQAAWEARYEAGPDSPAGLDNSRRTELQASCYGGMFLAAVAGRGVDQVMVDQMLTDAAWRGDQPNQPRDHGSPATNGAWTRHGAQLNRTFQCNTWVAPAESVQ